ncbi:hypothetical protein D3C75_870440 [compost metagenome]
MGELLECQFIIKRNVIGKQHHIQVVFQRLTRFTGRESAVDGNHRKVSFRDIVMCAGKGCVTRFVACIAAVFAGEQTFNGFKRGVVRRIARTFDNNHQVAIFGLFEFVV